MTFNTSLNVPDERDNLRLPEIDKAKVSLPPESDKTFTFPSIQQIALAGYNKNRQNAHIAPIDSSPMSPNPRLGLPVKRVSMARIKALSNKSEDTTTFPTQAVQSPLKPQFPSALNPTSVSLNPKLELSATKASMEEPALPPDEVGFSEQFFSQLPEITAGQPLSHNQVQSSLAKRLPLVHEGSQYEPFMEQSSKRQELPLDSPPYLEAPIQTLSLEKKTDEDFVIGENSKVSKELLDLSLDLANPDISLRNLLEIDNSMKYLFSKKAPLKLFQNTAKGTHGKVKFVRFKYDNIKNRSFAVKRPRIEAQRFFDNEIQANQAALNAYNKNLSISQKVNGHPCFMKVHGVVVKTKSGKISKKPYLILEHIKGSLLRDVTDLNKSQKIELLNQLKEAIFHLYTLNIAPIDINPENVIITKDNKLKLIDFDAWNENPSQEDLVRSLYLAFSQIIGGLKMTLPPLKGGTFEDLQNALNFN